MSFLNFCTPTVGSICQGGICRVITRCLIAFAHGRLSSYVTSDIGAIDPEWWHSWHFSCKIGATSLANVTALAAGAELPLPTSAAIKMPEQISNVAYLMIPPLTVRRNLPTARQFIHANKRVSKGVRIYRPSVAFASPLFPDIMNCCKGERWDEASFRLARGGFRRDVAGRRGAGQRTPFFLGRI